MTAPLWMVAGLACAQLGGMIPENGPRPVEEAPAPRPAASRIVAVTVYQGQALVTREVSVPEGLGTIEVVVTPLPAATVANSLDTEGADGVRVLSTRFRTRAAATDTRAEIRAKEDLIKQLDLDAQRLHREIAVQGEDLHYLQQLEGFTTRIVGNSKDGGQLEDVAIINLSNFVMDHRATKARREVDLNQLLQANTAANQSARRQLDELASGGRRVERDAVIVISKTRPEPATIRLGHLVSAATWEPRYRLRAAGDEPSVQLEYLAAVVQRTGESWPAVRVTLSTARPSVDAAPPDLLPLKMVVADGGSSGPVDAHDPQSERIMAELAKAIDMPFTADRSLEEVIKYIRQQTQSRVFPDGIPIYVDPQGLQDADKTLASTVAIDLKGIPLKTTLALLLRQLNLIYEVNNGLLTITTYETAHGDPIGDDPRVAGAGGSFGGAGGMGGGGMGGGGMGLSIEQAQVSGGTMLNRAAAGNQAAELRVGDGPSPGLAEAERDAPSVSFTLPAPVAIPSALDPRLLEVGRVDLPAEFSAKAVPVLTPRVYRLAKLTNKSDLVLLPGEATVYVGAEFVGRMKLPLVAAGEPFTAGFGVDPQVQVSRRLVGKTRTIQGGNQVFTYEFRINLRNYRPTAAKVQLWDRFPTAEGEAVAVKLSRTSTPLSTDPLYEKTARADNLLRWDLDVPAGTTGDKPLSLTHEFRIEYARDLPPPRFQSGGLGEAPIGGPAVGGVGGMGGFQSVGPERTRATLIGRDD